ncbi:MAG TPA: universal stress protein [Bacillota bacterium]|nr:universal stress protein [Bacillota bacterium]
MKFKPTDKKRGVVVELGPQEAQLPTLPAEEVTAAPPAFKLQRILVPVDFSDCAKKALQYAICFAKQFEAELTLLHVVPSNPPLSEMGPVDIVSVEDLKRDLEALQASIKNEVRSRAVLRVQRAGEPHLEIIRVAKELDIDLIILSTHGRTGLARMFLGSTTEKVVRYAACPVLVVREHEHEFLEPSLLNPESSEAPIG